MSFRLFFRVVVICSLAPLAAVAAPIRIKDLVEFDGVRGNDLVGYGLVVGLNGTGDGLRNAPFTEDALSNILERSYPTITFCSKYHARVNIFRICKVYLTAIMAYSVK